MTHRFKSMGLLIKVKYRNVTTFPCNMRCNIPTPNIPVHPFPHYINFSVAIEAGPTFGYAIQIFQYL